MMIVVGIIGILILTQCNGTKLSGLKYETTYSVDTSITTGDTTITRTYQTEKQRAEKKTLWILISVVVVYLGIFLLKK